MKQYNIDKKQVVLALIFILVVGGLGLPAVLAGVFRPMKIEDTIVVQGSVPEVFAFVSDVNNAGNLSEHLADIKLLPAGARSESVRYSRTLLIHGQPNPQEVTATSDEPNKVYVTRTALYGFDIVYTYRFVSLETGAVEVALTKEAGTQGWTKILTPLIRHLLTRPEHDGQHLQALKTAIES